MKFNLSKARKMLEMGNLMLQSYRSLLDKINMWPMPDNDTGKNLCETAGSIVERVNALADTADYNAFADAVSFGAIVGSRGNSGTIFAAWITGVCDYLRDRELTQQVLGDALQHGHNEACTKIGEPKQGSMLTVMADIAVGAMSATKVTTTDAGLFDVILDIAQSSVDNTENLLSVLKKAGVVDSGAAGLMLFLEGMRKSQLGDNSTESSYARFADFAPHIDVEKHQHSTKTKFRYCVQVIFKTAKPLHFERERAFLGKIGDSEVVINFRDVYKIHVHTNHPQRVINHFGGFGEVQSSVDDMFLQSANAKNPPRFICHDATAIITDATADISATDLEKYGIDVVGMSMRVGKTRFLHLPDWSNMSEDEFYGLLAEYGASSFATEAVSEYEWLERATPYLEKGTDVVFVTMSDALSSTFLHALNATGVLRQKFPNRQIACVNSRTTSAGLTFVATKLRT
ncbi:MAG: DAK2 domain-containing protein, partial [Candidatus Nomurabacteria bacterium]|nr:DAK2 domain-containing protein [Candidatus Nomurabacteria bacterium]